MTTYYARSFKDLRVYQNSMMEKADSFCGPLDSTLHESTVEYFTSPDETATDD